MTGVLDLSSYHFDVLSVPFIAAGLAVLVVLTYVLFTNGAPILRGSLLIVCTGLLLFVIGYAAVGSTSEPEVALQIYRLSLSLLPMSAAGTLLFLLALANRAAHHRVLIAVALGSAVPLAVVTAATDLVVRDVWLTPSGLYYFHVSLNGLAQLHASAIGVWVSLGVFLVWRRIRKEPSAARRKQLRGSILSFSICTVGLVDMPLGYGIGWYPVSWAFLTVGVLLALRLLIVDDLIHARELDRRVPEGILYLAGAAAGVWAALRLIGPDAAPALVILALVAVLLVMRLLSSLRRALATRDRTDDTPLDRAMERFSQRVQRMRVLDEIGGAAVELVELGIGSERVELLIPSRDDYSWERLDQETVPESHTPDPLLLVWFAQFSKPLSRDGISALRLGDLRQPLESLFAAHQAEVLVPLVNRDELVGMLAVGALPGGRAVRQEELAFLERMQEQTAAALVFARMSREATERVEVDKEVGLAAAVQAAFVPGDDLIQHARLELAGVYQPASKCGGDWWSVHEAPDGRVLVLIGDVTGHGIAAAMVTAAAKGCYDVAQQLMGDELDLPRLLELLDAVVRRAGGTQFFMTCFATLIDAEREVVRFANAGHVVPYLCRPQPDGSMSLDVLVARGDPLGAGDKNSYTEHQRDVLPGDLLIWYTDGLVECVNASRLQFGDRRMQRMLKRMSADTTDVRSVRDQVVRAAVAFQEGHPADDDITLVVGRVA